MIKGTIPLITLWVIVVCSTALLLIHLAVRRWWRDQMTLHLVAFAAATAVWWGLILVGSYSSYPHWLQVTQAVAFIAKGVVILWQLGLAVWWRVKRRRARRAAR